MANNLNTNPMFFDTTGSTSEWTTEKRILLIQWVDDNADIADNNNLIMTVNEAVLEATIQTIAAPDHSNAVVWQIGPFAKGIPVWYFILTTMTAGNVHIWLE